MARGNESFQKRKLRALKAHLQDFLEFFSFQICLPASSNENDAIFLLEKTLKNGNCS